MKKFIDDQSKLDIIRQKSKQLGLLFVCDLDGFNDGVYIPRTMRQKIYYNNGSFKSNCIDFIQSNCELLVYDNLYINKLYNDDYTICKLVAFDCEPDEKELSYNV